MSSAVAAGRRDRHPRLRGGLVALAAVALPAVLWHETIAAIASAFRLEAAYLVMGWTPWVLMALGLACFIPVALEARRDPGRRFARRGTGAWLGWGITLYLLGFLLATQVVQIAGLWLET